MTTITRPPEPTNAPTDAIYGVYNYLNKTWIEWLCSDDEAAEASEDVGRSGLPLVVLGVNGTDDRWLDEYEY